MVNLVIKGQFPSYRFNCRSCFAEFVFAYLRFDLTIKFFKDIKQNRKTLVEIVNKGQKL